MSSISAVIITYNESANIARCISSLKNVVDEITVSDSNSTDDTKNIAEQLGAKVFVRAFEGYGATKNFANNQATNNWIFSIGLLWIFGFSIFCGYLWWSYQLHRT
jgi:glycosyltransferase involved in cell wall biosynthesis